MTDICKFETQIGSEQQELLCAFVKGSSDNQHILQSWTRKQVKEYVNDRTGIEKAFRSYSKCKLIEHLVKTLTVDDGKPITKIEPVSDDAINKVSLNVTRMSRKGKHPTKLTAVGPYLSSPVESSLQFHIRCENLACKAELTLSDSFCKRCSCYICHQFDNNKDPSFWIVCEKDLGQARNGCGLSCHLECALNRQVTGIIQAEEDLKVDDCYRCLFCGKATELLGFWKKQLLIATEARQIDVLCHRLSLAHRLLEGSYRHQELQSLVDDAVQKLEAEIGPVTEASSKLVRGIVSKFSTASDAQKLLERALMKFETLTVPQEAEIYSQIPATLQDALFSIGFHKVSSFSMAIVLHVPDVISGQEIVWHEVWHRKASHEYSKCPTFSGSHSNLTACVISGLEANTEYVVRVIAYSRKGTKEQTEANCFTKSSEHLAQHLTTAGMIEPSLPSSIEKLFYDADEIKSTFKVRELANIVSPSSNQASADESYNKSEAMESHNLVGTTKSGAHKQDFPCKSAFEIVRHGHQKQSENSKMHKLPIKSNTYACKLALEMLFKHHSLHTRNLFGSVLGSQGSWVAFLSANGVMVHKNPLSNDVSSSPTSEELEQSDSKIVKMGCFLKAVAGKGKPSDHGQFHTNWYEIRWNDHRLSLPRHPHIDENASNLEFQRKRKRKPTEPGQAKSPDQKWEGGWQHEREASTKSSDSGNFEYSVKVLRWLEQLGEVGGHFRMRFLSWLGVGATDEQKKVIDAYIRVMINDPQSLAEQLIHTYQEIISITRPKFASSGCFSEL